MGKRMTPGARLRAERLLRGETQTEFAELIGVHPSYLSEVECGRRPVKAHTLKILLQQWFNVPSQDWDDVAPKVPRSLRTPRT
jgi:transcriptional regulator with XRE-family HTH domain